MKNENSGMQLSVRFYQSNLRIFAYADAYEDGVLVGTLDISFEGFGDYGTHENMADIEETILDKFPNVERESLRRVLSTISIYVDAISK